jgi:hypothetical protein
MSLSNAALAGAVEVGLVCSSFVYTLGIQTVFLLYGIVHDV